jgi:hypothetical protein
VTIIVTFMQMTLILFAANSNLEVARVRKGSPNYSMTK